MKKLELSSTKVEAIQLKIFFSMIILYSFYFAANYNLGPAARSIQDQFNITTESFGILFTIFSFFFACGQFASGYLGDRFSAKKIMIIGALGGAVANFLFGISGHYALFITIWAINALFLSMGWSPGCSILFNWFPIQFRGRFMGIYNAFSFLGGVIIYPILGYSIVHYGWRSAFFIPSFLLVFWTIIFILNVHDTPKDAGYDVQWRSNEKSCKTEIVGLKDYLFVLRHPIMHLIYLTAICSQFIRWGLVNWIVKILIEPPHIGGFGINLVLATTIASSIHWGGVLLSVAFGYISDVCFKGSRWQVIFGGFIICALSLTTLYFYGFWLLSSKTGMVFFSALLFLAGGCIQGLQAPMFNLPGEILGNRLGGTGVGITNGWSYIGASFSGVILGNYLVKYGFLSGFIIMAGISVTGAIILLVFQRMQPINSKD